jgi:hypothetical protein
MPLFNNLGILTGSIYLYKDGDALVSGSKLTISPDFTTTGKYDFIYEATGSTSVKLLTLSSSGQDPRIGIGNENPQTTLDIKEVKDDAVGAEILIRSSRTTKGGEVNDGAGRILFVIDSGSYTDIKSSGSIAIITTEVKAIDSKAAGGDLIFKVSDADLTDPIPYEMMRLSRDRSRSINDLVTVSGFISASGNILSDGMIKGESLTSDTDISAGSGYVYAQTMRIGSNVLAPTKGLYVSGNISSSNDLSIRGFPSVSSSLASLTGGSVTQIIAGTNITISPLGGTGVVTINASGSGGSTFPYTGSAIISGSLIITGSTNSRGGFTGSLLGTASYALNTPPDAPQPILLRYTSSTNPIDTPPSGYILEIDGLPDFVRLNTQSFNNINLAPGGFPDFYFNQPGSLLTVRATGSGAFKTYKVLSYTNASNYAEYTVQLPYIISSGTLNNGDIVEFRWDKSADVGNLSKASITDAFGTYNVGAVDLFFNNASFVIPGLSETSTLSYTGSGYIAASITRSANLTIRSLNATTAITSSIISASGGITGSLFGTASWAISSSRAITASHALTSSFINNLNQNLSITGAVVLSGSSLPELRVIGDTQFTGSINSLNGYTGSLFGTSSWALNVVGGGGGGVTINNNVDNYLVTATGTANTLDGESSLTFDGVTLTVGGNISATAIDVRDDPSTTIGDYAVGSHIARDWVAAGGPALTAGNIVYFSGSQQWANAQANATGSSTRVLGVVTSNADPNEIVLQGTVTVNTDLATYQIGQPVYLSPLTAGGVTNVPPSSSGHVARYVGWVVDTSRDQIYFNPDFTYIQL